jgi:glycosyltransferase involved in cell wall biosynthesis
MRLTQVAPYASYPPRLGGDHRTHGLVKEFPKFDDTVERFCQGGTPATYRSLDLRREVQILEGYTEYRHLHPIYEVLKAPMLLGYPNVFQSNVLRVINDGLERMLDRSDIVLAREPWQTPYVLDTVDTETPVVFSSHNVETERFGDIQQPVLGGWIRDKVDRLERRSVEGADAVVCTSERDADVYRERYELDCPIVVVPNGTYEDDLRNHRPNSDAAEQLRTTYGIAENATVCLFMGSNYRPNVDAAKVTIEIADRLKDETPPIEFLIIGSVGKALDGSSSPDNVTVTGYVKKDFEEHFDAADIALNPMRSGGGTNIKLIDYFARSLPVISTPFGGRGLDRETGNELVIVDLDDFPHAIRELSNDRQRRRRIGSAGRDLAAERYTWESSSRKLHEFIYEEFGPF